MCSDWAERNRIAFSPKKSVAMWLVRPSVLSEEFARVGHENLRLHGVALDVVKSFCYLGIDITGDGAMTNSCSATKITKAETRIDQLKGMLRGDRSLSPRLGLNIVRAKINSTLLYGCGMAAARARRYCAKEGTAAHYVCV